MRKYAWARILSVINVNYACATRDYITIYIRRGETCLYYLYARTRSVLVRYYVVVGFTLLPSRFRALIFVRSRSARARALEIVEQLRADRCTGRPYVTTLPMQGCTEMAEKSRYWSIQRSDEHGISKFKSETMPELYAGHRLFLERRGTTLAAFAANDNSSAKHSTYFLDRTRHPLRSAEISRSSRAAQTSMFHFPSGG